MNAIYEAIIEIAEELAENGETMTFDELAERLDDYDFDDEDFDDDDDDDDDDFDDDEEPFYGGRAMASRVAAAYRYAYNTDRPDEAEMIADSFTDRNGNYPYELYE